MGITNEEAQAIVNAARESERERCAEIADLVAEECRKYPGTCFAYCGEARCDDVAAVIRGEKSIEKVLEPPAERGEAL